MSNMKLAMVRTVFINTFIGSDKQASKQNKMIIIIKNEHKMVNTFLFTNFNMKLCFGAQKNHLIETVLLRTHNICFV